MGKSSIVIIDYFFFLHCDKNSIYLNVNMCTDTLE